MKVKSIAEYKAREERSAQAAERMADLRKDVLAHVETLFEFCEGVTDQPDQDYGNKFCIYYRGVEITAYSFLPGGVFLNDRNGNQIIFYWDILRNRVVEA